MTSPLTIDGETSSIDGDQRRSRSQRLLLLQSTTIEIEGEAQAISLYEDEAEEFPLFN